jgi:hypothetical protein
MLCCVLQGRAVGMFGCLDLVGPDGNLLQQARARCEPRMRLDH